MADPIQQRIIGTCNDDILLTLVTTQITLPLLLILPIPMHSTGDSG